MSQPLRDYELVMALSPAANPEEADSFVQKISDFITEKGGTTSEPKKWGVRRLSFPIRRFQEGNYIAADFTLSASSIMELEHTLTASEDVLVHLVARTG